VFRHRLQPDTPLHISSRWLVLTFLAGAVNAGGFLAFERFVTHMTGFATLAGIAAAQGDVWGLLSALTVPVFFVVGVMAAASMTLRRRRYGLVMGIVCVCLLVVAHGLAGDYLPVALLCFASGLQNGAVANASGSTVRTTHMTGVTTDLGLGLVAMLGAHPAERATLRRLVFFRLATLLAFACGSAAGGYAFLQYGLRAFLLPAALAAWAAFTASDALADPSRPG
jgi:uncharacterized membrane protein YoaK (UPF0700 family)